MYCFNINKVISEKIKHIYHIVLKMYKNKTKIHNYQIKIKNINYIINN